MVIVVSAFLIVGILAGGFTINALTKNDGFVINAVNGQVNLEIGGEGNPDSYTEGGAKCVFFGKDISDTVTTKYYYREDMTYDVSLVSGIDCDVPGYYYVVYTSSHIKYQGVQLVRNVTVTKEED